MRSLHGDLEGITLPQPALLSRSCSLPLTYTHKKQMQVTIHFSLVCRLLCLHVPLHIPLKQGDTNKDRDQGAAHSHHNRDPCLLCIWGLLPTKLQTAPVRSSNTGFGVLVFRLGCSPNQTAGHPCHKQQRGRRAARTPGITQCSLQESEGDIKIQGLGGLWQVPRSNPHSQTRLCLVISQTQPQQRSTLAGLLVAASIIRCNHRTS